MVVSSAAQRLDAQGVRITGVTTARYIEVMPLGRAADSTVSNGQVALLPLTQDLHVNAWGFGQGVRLYAHVRGRASLGERGDIWPQADDAFDALSAYAEIDRPLGRLRLGRQWSSSHLGFYNFDGGALLARPRSWLTAELYGGWALAPGLNESVLSDALAAIEELVPGRRSNLLGAQLMVRRGRVRVAGEYQREIRTDRAGLYGERIAGDASIASHGWLGEAVFESDLVGHRINEARLRVRAPALARVQPTLELRTQQPYFPLWTIWGAFSPSGFDEASTSLAWSGAEQRLTLDVRGAYRSYHNDEADAEVFGGLRSDGWRAGLNAAWLATPTVTAFGHYQADINFGAARSDGGAGVRVQLGQFNSLSASLLAFQTVHELQVREGTVVGTSATASLRLTPAMQFNGSLALYRHLRSRGTDAIDWNQLRASVQLDWSLGADPGIRTARRGP